MRGEEESSGRMQELIRREERQYLARELHDSISQVFYAIGLGVHMVREDLNHDPAQAAKSIEYVLSLVEGGIAEVRTLMLGLEPEFLRTDGLIATLETQVRLLCTHNNLTMNAQFGEEPDVPLETKQMLYRIIQEALHNVIKHAHASIVTLRLFVQENEMIVEICDDGTGFDTTASFPSHFGLRSMRSRAAKLGGIFSAKSSIGQGTSIRVCIPC